MTDITIRPARPADLPAVGAITVEAYHASGMIDSTTEGYAVHLADAESRHAQAELLVAVSSSDEVLGSVTIVRPGTEWAEISRPGELEFRMLSVSPAARGKGVGEALTRAVLDRARSLGLARVVMSSSEKMTSAHRIYERLGFTRLPERDWTPLPGVDLVAYAFQRDV